MINPNIEKAYQFYLLASNQGNEEAQFKLANFLLRGHLLDDEGRLTGEERRNILIDIGSINYSEALKYLLLSSNHPKSQFLLGQLYENGDGVTADFEIAYQYYKKSADSGDSDAQFKVGSLFYNSNDFISQDYSEAFKYLKLSSNQGSPNANFLLGKMYELGQGVQKNLKEAFRYYNVSSDQGNPESLYCVGRLYQRGQVDAKVWLFYFFVFSRIFLISLGQTRSFQNYYIFP